MSEQTTNRFKIKNINFPKLDFLFLAHTNESDFDYAFRVEGIVADDKNLRMLFGVRLTSKDKVNETTPKINVTVEAIGEFEFEQALPEVKTIIDVPLAGNILALMYPFIREKIYYCFSNNAMSLFLPPINTIQLVQENHKAPNFKITDGRTAKLAADQAKTT